jgi:hypothetical protein
MLQSLVGTMRASARKTDAAGTPSRGAGSARSHGILASTRSRGWGQRGCCLVFFVSHRLQPQTIYEALSQQDGLRVPTGTFRTNGNELRVERAMRPAAVQTSCGESTATTTFMFTLTTSLAWRCSEWVRLDAKHFPLGADRTPGLSSTQSHLRTSWRPMVYQRPRRDRGGSAILNRSGN